MENVESIQKLKDFIYETYKSTKNTLSPNILRGHLRSLSTDIEDGIAMLIIDIMPNGYKVFLDPSIYVDGRNNRPDLMIVDSDNNVVAIVEIKANMGWCGDASSVINNLISNHNKFANKQKLVCEFSKTEKQEVCYCEKVKLFLVSFTDWNCCKEKHEKNKLYAKGNNVFQYNLFTGWYDSLVDFEIDDFINEIKK